MANKNLTEMIFILDRSGSMAGLESDTIGGYNSLIDKQKKEVGDAVVTTVLFNDRYEIIHDRVDIQKIDHITGKHYSVGGMTALLDAVGMAIDHVGKRHKNALDSEVPNKTMVTIITDGQENSSREYSLKQIKKMIEHQKEKYGWEFLFLGANIDAVTTAAGFGISADRAVTYEADSVGTRMNFDAVSDVVGCVRQCAPIASNWKEDIEKHRSKKKR